MTYSENYNFALPEDEDSYDISSLSENFEALDSILTENESTMGEINEKIGTPTESGQTLFSLLENNNSGTGLTAIKSLQRITSGDMKAVKTVTVEIQPVDPTKCICILERLQDQNTAIDLVDYSLSTDSVTFTTNGLNVSFIVGLWIIEFC